MNNSGVEDFSAFELVSDALYATKTRTEQDEQAEFIHMHPDMHGIVAKDRIAEEGQWINGDYHGVDTGKTLPKDAVIHSVNGQIALALQGHAGAGTIVVQQCKSNVIANYAAVLPHMPREEMGEFIREMRRFGRLNHAFRPEIEKLLHKAFARLDKEAMPPVTRDHPKLFFEETSLRMEHGVWRLPLPPAQAAQASMAPMLHPTLWVANVHRSDTPAWYKSWIRLQAPGGHVALTLTEKHVLVVDVIDGGTRLRFRAWKLHQLMQPKAKPPCVEYICHLGLGRQTLAHAMAACALHYISATKFLCAAIFNHFVLVVDPTRATCITLKTSAADGVVKLTSGYFVNADTLQLGTSIGSVFSLAWRMAHLIQCEAFPEETPVYHLQGVYNAPYNYVAHCIPNVHIIQNCIAPYQLHGSVTLGSSVCGALVATLCESGVAFVCNFQLRGAYIRHEIAPPRQLMRGATAEEQDQYLWPEEPWPEAMPEEARDKPLVFRWKLVTEPKYLYQGAWLGRNKAVIVYPGGAIRVLRLDEPKPTTTTK